MSGGGDDIQRRKWQPPGLLGYARAGASAHFVAAPLLTAAALSLAGVVGGADHEFLWPGPTLLLLVVSAMALIATIQLSYHARLYLYSYQDAVDWYSPEYVEDHRDRLRRQQATHLDEWLTYNNRAVYCFNAGTILLGLGVAAALAPPDDGRQVAWRWTAAAVVLLATVVEFVWVTNLDRKAKGRPPLTPPIMTPLVDWIRRRR